MTRDNVPEELFAARARVASAVAAYDTVEIDTALSALGKAACAIGDLELIPEELRPLLYEREQSPTLAVCSQAGESTVGTGAGGTREKPNRDSSARLTRGKINSVVTIGTLLLLAYGCITYRRQPQVSSAVEDVNWGGPSAYETSARASRQQFRPMPMVPAQAQIPQRQIAQPQVNGLQGFMAILGLVMAKEQYEQQMRAADAERRERRYLQQKMLDDANPYSRQFSAISPPGEPFPPAYGGHQSGARPAAPPRRQFFEGKCTRCPHRYHSEGAPGQSTCIIPSHEGLCGGVVAWAPTSGF